MSTQRYTLAKKVSRPASTPAPTGLLQPRVARQTEPVSIPSKVHEVINSPGQPLDPSTRGVMESRFGHNFGQVRIHNDAQAAESARAMQARAYTIGRHIGFGLGQYAPETSEGQQLLAHELVHVVQLMLHSPETQGIAAQNHSSEVEARYGTMGAVFIPVSVPGGVLQRQPEEIPLVPGVPLEIYAAEGFLEGAQNTIRRDIWDSLKQEFSQPANIAKFGLGWHLGVPEGAFLELYEALEGLVKIAIKLAPAIALLTIPGAPLLYEGYQLVKYRGGYLEHKQQQAETVQKLYNGLKEFIQRVIEDPTFLEQGAVDLGRAAGEEVGKRLNEFVGESSFKKGMTVGEIEGRILIEIALLFIGPEEIAARVAPLVGKLAEGSRLGGAVLKLLEKIPALREFLEASKLAGQAEKGVVTAGKGAEEVAAGAREAEKALAGKAPHVEPHTKPPAPRPKQEPAPAPQPKQEPAPTPKPAPKGKKVAQPEKATPPETPVQAEVEVPDDEAIIDEAELLEQRGVQVRKPVDIRLAEAKEGRLFDILEGERYPANQVPIRDKSGKLRRLDSFDPIKGEIVSRKSLSASQGQLAFVEDPFTVIEYYQEFALKYPDGALIANVPAARKMGLANKVLKGKYILEVPVQRYPIPELLLEEARKRGIIIRDVVGKTYP